MSYAYSELHSFWEASRIAYGRDPFWWRVDWLGRLMHRMEYGNRQSEYGWEVDHVWPKSLYGSDNAANLEATNWRTNAAKSDRIPSGVFGVGPIDYAGTSGYGVKSDNIPVSLYRQPSPPPAPSPWRNSVAGSDSVGIFQSLSTPPPAPPLDWLPTKLPDLSGALDSLARRLGYH